MIRTPGADLERIQTPHPREGDESEARLRPKRLDEFIGQPELKAQLEISIRAAADRNEALDHVLLAGPPGLGKTSLARIVAEELGVRFVQTAGPALERKAEIAAFLTDLEPRSRLLRRRDPPPAARRGGDVLSRDGGRPAPDHARRRRGRQGRHARPPGVHADRRDDTRRPAHDAAPGPLRHPAPARPLRRRRSRRDRRPQRQGAQHRDPPRRRARDRRAPPRHPARRQPAAQARPRLRADRTPTARSTRTPPTRRSTCSRSTTRAWTGWTARSSSRSANGSQADQSGCPRSRSPCRRSRTRSRTSTSPTCCSAASSPARRAAAARRRTRSAISGSSRRAQALF